MATNFRQKVVIELELGEWAGISELLHVGAQAYYKSPERLKKIMDNIEKSSVDDYDAMLMTGVIGAMKLDELLAKEINHD